jgi:hypothetical protein
MNMKLSNLNKLVTVALQDYVNNKKRHKFEKSMLEWLMTLKFCVNVW